MKKSSAIVLATVIGVGGLAAAAAIPAVAGAASSAVLTPAADDSGTPPQDQGLQPPDLGGMGGMDDRDGDRPDPAIAMRGALDGLVADGTITADQADAVVAALVEAMPARGPHGPGGHGGPGMHGPGPALDVLADTLGMTPDEVRQALIDGQSVADLAKAKGVALATVVDALVAEAKAHLAEEVAEGDLTQQEADQRLKDIRTRVEQMVQQSGLPGPEHDGGRGMGGPGMGGPGMGDHHDAEGDADGDA